MGSPEQLNCFKRVGAFVAYFSIATQNPDWPYSRICTFPDRRLLWIRPVAKDSKTTSVYLIHLSDNVPALRQANAAFDRQKQKEGFAELYSGLGWEVPRVVDQMLKSDNFYSDELVQVVLKKWSQDRVVLLGDSAWAPTPLTGQGNQLAIIGGWVLAQELSRNRSAVAFENYEKRLRAYVETSQKIPLGGYAPYMVVSQTTTGIGFTQTFFFLLSWIVRFFFWSGLTKLLPESKPDHDFDLQMEHTDANVARSGL